MRKAFFTACFFAFLSVSSFASVALFNDSPFTLKAVAVTANGMNIGEVVVKPQETKVINDPEGGSNPTDPQQQPLPQNPNTAVTPYTVFWYCSDGSSYSTCQNVGAGAMVTPNTGEGSKYCKPPRQQTTRLPTDSDSSP